MSIIINLIQSILITEMPVTHSSRVSPLIVSGELSGLLVTCGFATHHSALLVSKEYPHKGITSHTFPSNKY